MSPVFGVVTASRRDQRAALNWAFGRLCTCRQSLWTTTQTSDPHNSSSSGSASKETPKPPPGPASVRLPLSVPAYTVWGANTNVGKTLVSVGLSYAASKLGVSTVIRRPVQLAAIGAGSRPSRIDLPAFTYRGVHGTTLCPRGIQHGSEQQQHLGQGCMTPSAPDKQHGIPVWPSC